MTTAGILFVVVLVAEVVLGIALAATLTSRVRVWPPPGRRSWQFWLMWSLLWTALIGLVSLGLVEWDSWIFGDWVRYSVGAVLLVGGLALVGWGVTSLGIQATSGLNGHLVVEGPYRFSRNPQYVGEVIWLVGYAVLANSALVLICAGVGSALFLIVPFTEEPWLREHYGDAFDQYAARVPRYVGRLTLPHG